MQGFDTGLAVADVEVGAVAAAADAAAGTVEVVVDAEAVAPVAAAPKSHWAAQN